MLLFQAALVLCGYFDHLHRGPSALDLEPSRIAHTLEVLLRIMGSLFDLAADLTEYALPEPSSKGLLDYGTNNQLPYQAASRNQEHNDLSQMSTLALLDDTLLTMYDSHRDKRSQVHPQRQAQRSAPQIIQCSVSTEDLDRRLTHYTKHPPRSGSSPTLRPLQSVFSHSVSYSTADALVSTARRSRVPPPPPLPKAPTPTSPTPPTPSTYRKQSPAVDPDVTAKSALRDLAEEIGQLPTEARASSTQVQRLQRALSEKYLNEKLNILPNTPFVLLARKKTQQKINQLAPSPSRQPTTEDTKIAHEPVKSVAVFPSDQHEMLLKLASIPDAHVAKLGATQAKMVHFAKRYDKILQLSVDELARLPVSQTQLLEQLRRQLPPQLQHERRRVK